MPRRWEFRWSAGFVPRGTIFPGGTGFGFTPNKCNIHLPTSRPIPVSVTATGLKQLELQLTSELRDLIKHFEAVQADGVPNEFYSLHEVRR